MKAYTNLEQSRKLAEILPLESADGFYESILNPTTKEWNGILVTGTEWASPEVVTPAWSLAALMNIFPKEEGSCTSLSFGYYDANGGYYRNYIRAWLCCYEKEGESTDDYIIETIPADNPIDACVAMILKLKERNLL